MPRSARLDVADALYHVIARGVERRPIVRDDADRGDFVRRLGVLVGREGVRLFAFALMDNHVHLVVRRGPQPLGRLLQRLLTGYAGRFNRRHGRVGHLFQNRYKSVLCESDRYLLQLVRYVHLNPVRAGIVSDPERYQWTSHVSYLRRRPPEWLDTDVVLMLLGGRSAYRRFVADGIAEGRRADLNGEAHTQPDTDRQRWLGGQLLGCEAFAVEIGRAARRPGGDDDPGSMPPPVDLSAIASEVAHRFGLAPDALRSPARGQRLSAARRAFVRAAVVDAGARRVDAGRYLRISKSAVSCHLRAIEDTGPDR